MTTLAPGMFVHRATGSARLVPVRVSSTLPPRCMPRGTTGLSVGAAGFGTGGGGWPWTAEAAARTTMVSNAVNRRERLMALLVAENGRREGGVAGGVGSVRGDDNGPGRGREGETRVR